MYASSSDTATQETKQQVADLHCTLEVLLQQHSPRAAQVKAMTEQLLLRLFDLQVSLLSNWQALQLQTLPWPHSWRQQQHS
jgi:hypothetical protein